MLSGDETDKYAETHNAEYNPDEPNCAKTDTANTSRCSEADLAKKIKIDLAKNRNSKKRYSRSSASSSAS